MKGRLWTFSGKRHLYRRGREEKIELRKGGGSDRREEQLLFFGVPGEKGGDQENRRGV